MVTAEGIGSVEQVLVALPGGLASESKSLADLRPRDRSAEIGPPSLIADDIKSVLNGISSALHNCLVDQDVPRACQYRQDIGWRRVDA